MTSTNQSPYKTIYGLDRNLIKQIRIQIITLGGYTGIGSWINDAIKAKLQHDSVIGKEEK
jgi:2-phosphoglycerate kinase